MAHYFKIIRSQKLLSLFYSTDKCSEEYNYLVISVYQIRMGVSQQKSQLLFCNEHNPKHIRISIEYPFISIVVIIHCIGNKLALQFRVEEIFNSQEL